ncbi:hypothetical protein [Gluconobacter oxydans]|uniref:Uncharacterized protein n=1 Tax=Gluconobacter oxydans TaxID=442 RepID=A0AB35AVX2_GLUOY|nr:hypothetical protein [Gluconobacter oxydans]MBF0857579.1 hypothetical protein [Gluconobacter oxydans]GEC62143.1 hypothetical protein GOX01_24740 [Gluconobacter oxydans]
MKDNIRQNTFVIFRVLSDHNREFWHSSQKPYWVDYEDQAEVYLDRESAEREAERLEKLGYGHMYTKDKSEL